MDCVFSIIFAEDSTIAFYLTFPHIDFFFFFKHDPGQCWLLRRSLDSPIHQKLLLLKSMCRKALGTKYSCCLPACWPGIWSSNLSDAQSVQDEADFIFAALFAKFRIKIYSCLPKNKSLCQMLTTDSVRKCKLLQSSESR